jgi:hypothetical protein
VGCWGLEGLQQAQRAPQLGERAAAVAQQGVERAGAVAVTDQGQAEIAVHAMAAEQLSLDPLGALQPPGRTGDARGQKVLQGTDWRQLLDQRCLQRLELLLILAADHREPVCAHPVVERIARRWRHAFRSLEAP